ncbi:hypothetical protein CI610_00129 [invertebrate metagenome]|uniref:PhoPQ-activated pathogenicity-related protein n=1 Tax=invertebrate metagenome TaxID=1711999 RepID=A0A2H9TCA5_9ZZZZ
MVNQYHSYLFRYFWKIRSVRAGWLWFLLFVVSFGIAGISEAQSPLKQLPEQCDNLWLSAHPEQVIPCYLQRKEPDFGWHELASHNEFLTISGQKDIVNIREFSMVSQRWKTAESAKVNHPVWRHRVTLYTPEKRRSSTALLYINNGTLYSEKNSASFLSPNENLDFAWIAASTGSVIVNLGDVPNQLLTFGNGESLREDALMAFTWQFFLSNPESNMDGLLQLPMVKSAVKVMDMVQTLFSQEKTSSINKNNQKSSELINHFVVSGGSKRGWVSWLTAAHDKRVSAVIPMVIDILHMEATLKHIFAVYPHGNFAIRSYLPLRRLIGTPAMNALIAIVDPYRYRKQLSMPKYMISVTGDNFIPPDSSQYFYKELPGEKAMRVIPNVSHYIFRNDPQQISDAVLSFYGALLDKRPVPKLQWEQKKNQLVVKASVKPAWAKIWTGNNSHARDFRKVDENRTLSAFIPEPATFDKKGSVYELSLPLVAPEQGWRGVFAEVGFANGKYPELIQTTRLFVLPDKYPSAEENTKDMAHK